ncbi:hydroxyethylthiazole kinase [Curtanaerobium respiraculi]|uniref:hydroxyethylthiazole kinase n=1 Tax=Curtanaerobium respiraculi TaxID=2949669 RepID=UPI0024B331E3|nr:hydroxyethylthiazole kinase [Curtanaerobium respiraculi]
MNELIEAAAQAVGEARAKKPLAPAITNVITVDFVVNAQLAVGGSGAVTYLADEISPLASVSGALYINMGSLLPVHEAAVPAAIKSCAASGVPWVLDPVGIGLGNMRIGLYGQMRQFPPAIIRCNASEAIALAETWELDAGISGGSVRGVDSTDTVAAARGAAIALARFTHGAVAVSGDADLVTDGASVARVGGGSPLFTAVTGSGCSLGGVCAVYASVAEPFAAAVAASSAYAVAGERAAQESRGPASFKVAFLDELYRIVPADIAAADIVVEEA